jgi:hypothetical protein
MQRSRIFQIQVLLKLFPHLRQIVLLSCHFEVVDVHGEEELFFSVHIEAFPAIYGFETALQYSFLAVLLPVETCKWVPVQVQSQPADWIPVLVPGRRPLVSRKIDPGFFALVLRLSICSFSIGVTSRVTWHASDRIQELSGRQVRGSGSLFGEDGRVASFIMNIVALKDNSAFVHPFIWRQFAMLDVAQREDPTEVNGFSFLRGFVFHVLHFADRFDHPGLFGRELVPLFLDSFFCRWYLEGFVYANWCMNQR